MIPALESLSTLDAAFWSLVMSVALMALAFGLTVLIERVLVPVMQWACVGCVLLYKGVFRRRRVRL